MRPDDVVLPDHLAAALLVVVRSAAVITPSLGSTVALLCDRIQAARLREAEWAKTPLTQRLGARVITIGQTHEPRDRWEQGTVVHVWPAVPHESDCYVLVAWDDLHTKREAVQDPDGLVAL